MLEAKKHSLEYQISKAAHAYGMIADVIDLPNGWPIIIVHPSGIYDAISIDEKLAKGQYRGARNYSTRKAR